MLEARPLVPVAVVLAVLCLLTWSWRAASDSNAERASQIHAAGLEHCPAHARTRWRGELICDKFFVDNPQFQTPSESGGQILYDERPRPTEW